jgi:hypothetical protein
VEVALGPDKRFLHLVAVAAQASVTTTI